jgi:hypothetical protein
LLRIDHQYVWLFRDPRQAGTLYCVERLRGHGEQNVTLRYRSIDLVWRPAARLVRFVIVRHPPRGTVFLLATDLTLEPMEIILLYSCRFKIELGFRQAVHVVESYAYHFWMAAMKPRCRGQCDQYLHRESQTCRDDVRRKMKAFHRYVRLGCVAPGLLQQLALNHTAEVWRQFRSWLRTINPALPPSELVVACPLRATLPEFLQAAGYRTNRELFSAATGSPTTPRNPTNAARSSPHETGKTWHWPVGGMWKEFLETGLQPPAVTRISGKPYRWRSDTSRRTSTSSRKLR